MTKTTLDAIDLAISALQRAKDAKLRHHFIDELDTALREIGDVVFVEDLAPTEYGITTMVMPVIIQLKMMSHLIHLDTNPRGKKK